MKRITKHPLFWIIGASILLYLPIFLNPSALFNRANDLQEQFWPIFYFVKTQTLENHTLPLWNNLFFSGTPLLPDPQSPLFYLPNIIFLFLPLGTAFIMSFFLHTLLGGIGAYLSARYGFGLSKSASLFSAALYIAAPQIAGRLEAGHFGLVNSFAWLPFVVLATIKLAKEPKFRWSTLLSISLAGLFFTHVLIFSIAAIVATLVFVVAQFIARSRRRLKSAITSATTFFILGALLTFGLVAITFLPQLEWKDQTTRFILLETRDVYPKWTSVTEFLQVAFWPWNAIEALDTEKWLALGILPTALALLGFFHLKRRIKILLATLVGAVTLIALNNASPLYSLLLGQDWYVLMRVATRVWFIPLLIVTFLASFGFDRLSVIATKYRLVPGKQSLTMLIAVLAVGELLLLSWLRLQKPVPAREFAPREVYEFLQNDQDRFRVFCTTRCLSQQEAVKAGLELVDGYNTFQQLNYFKHTWQLMGGYWGYYTLAVPPPGAYKFGKPQPDAASLGEYNTKYVISPYELNDASFVQEKKFGDYLVYRNKALLPRAYFLEDGGQAGKEAPIAKYTPNHIRVDTSSQESQHLVLAEVYSPGWKAYLNGDEEVTVQETPNALRFVDLKESTKLVDFRYQPESYGVGKIITGITVVLLLIILLKNKFYTST